ncbi:DoxX family protein [Streptomyces curacoi]|uniref:DoxX family protein n=1 Tax=Streptomyces curacoi TaxID=146536 RepID=UPI000A428CF7|nr:DoxX family protein [Streptomyces curacoi]
MTHQLQHRGGRGHDLAVGLSWQPLGIAAAVGFGNTMIGAVAFHAEAGDYANAATRGNVMAPIILTPTSVPPP